MQDDLDPRREAERQDARKLNEREQRAAEIAEIAWLMDAATGRKIVFAMLTQAGVFRSSFAGDPYTTAFNEGQRNIGLWLLSRVQNFTPAQYAIMIEEQKNGR